MGFETRLHKTKTTHLAKTDLNSTCSIADTVLSYSTQELAQNRGINTRDVAAYTLSHHGVHIGRLKKMGNKIRKR